MTTKTLKTKSAALTATAIAVITAATLLSAPAAMAALKTKDKRPQCNERGATACDAAIVEQEMTRCATGKMVFSWGSNDRSEFRSQSEIDFPNDRKTLDTVTTNAEGNRGQVYATPHVALCSALQKATMAINADREKLSALDAKVSVHDFNVMTRQLLLDNGVPADLLGDPADAAAGRRKFFRLKENVRSGSEAPTSLQITINWDSATSGSKDYVGHVSLIKL